MSGYRVLVTTSGTGSRLGELTKFTNKALVKVGRKPAISYIIDLYPSDTEFVITTGYFGDQVREFLELAYPDRAFTFVPVDTYEGPGSSLGYSILQARSLLQTPFIYHACDTIVTKLPPVPNQNWAGGFRGVGSSHYASFDTVDGKIKRIMDKGESIKPDFLHIGLIGIVDVDAFWHTLEQLYHSNPSYSQLGDVHVINQLLQENLAFSVEEFSTWHDIGNVESLTEARASIDDSFQVLDKSGETIFLFPTFVIKFFADQELTAQRVQRAQILKGLVPPLEGSGAYFYRYPYIEGALFSDVADRPSFRSLLHWSTTNLWQPISEVPQNEFQDRVRSFYAQKTLDRVAQFQQTRDIKDRPMNINGIEVAPLEELLRQIDFNWLSQTEQTHFHGDFILDNILKTNQGFTLIDWRQNFGGLLKAGDKYYDLAKLNHNLVINHEIIHQNLFSIEISDNQVRCDILRKQRLVECQEELQLFLLDKELDVRKVQILTALIWLNMSPLHHHPFDDFLYYFGSYQLALALTANQGSRLPTTRAATVAS